MDRLHLKMFGSRRKTDDVQLGSWLVDLGRAQVTSHAPTSWRDRVRISLPESRASIADGRAKMGNREL